MVNNPPLMIAYLNPFIRESREMMPIMTATALYEKMHQMADGVVKLHELWQETTEAIYYRSIKNRCGWNDDLSSNPVVRLITTALGPDAYITEILDQEPVLAVTPRGLRMLDVVRGRG